MFKAIIAPFPVVQVLFLSAHDKFVTEIDSTRGAKSHFSGTVQT